MHRNWAVWEKPWLQYWRLYWAWANATTSVFNEYYIQWYLDGILPENEDGRESSEPNHTTARTVLENKMRTKIRDSIEPRKIDRELLDQLPKLAARLRNDCRGDHRGITKRLHQAYQFTAHDDVYLENLKRLFSSSSSDSHHGEPGHEKKQKLSWSRIDSGKNLVSFLDGYMCPISYPDEIKKEVYETLRLFIKIEQKTMNELITEEYVREQFNKIKETINETVNEVDWAEYEKYFEYVEESL